MFTRIPEKRSTVYRVLFSVWVLVAMYAVAHDQYVVRLEPRHFTEYHAPIPGVSGAPALAAVHALTASVGPGLLLGLACLGAAWSGPWPRLGPRFIVGGVIVVLLLTEATALLSWLWVARFKSSFYPSFLLPETGASMIATQTIQLTCYLAGGVFSCGLLAVMASHRFRLKDRSTRGR